MPVQGTPFVNEYLNANNESPYHVITKNGFTKDCQLMKKVVLILIDKNFTASLRDNGHCLPIYYLEEHQFDELYEDLRKITRSSESGSRDDLLKQVKKELSQKDYTAALRSCNSALMTFDPNEMQGINKEVSSLMRNISECHLNLGDVQAALKTANDSVKFNPTCDKAYCMLGDVLFSGKNYQPAIHTYTNALVIHTNGLTFPTTNISRMVEILKKICLVFLRLNNKDASKNIQALIPFPVGFDIWVWVLHSFILERELEAAKYIANFMRTINVVYVELDFDLEPLCGIELLAKFPECMFFIAYLIICGCKYTSLSTQQGDTFINAAVRMTCLTGIPNVLKGVCHHLQTGENSSITDCKGNSGLHIAAAQKIEKTKIGRHEVIEILITTNINPSLENKDGKLAIDLLPKDDKRSRKVLEKHMTKMIAFEDKPEHHGRANSPATQLKSAAALNKKQQTENQIQKREEQNNEIEDKCKPCQDTFNKCKNIILEDPSLAFKDLIRLIRSKHRSPRHKQIEKESVLMISDFLAESSDFEIPEELCKIAQKQFEKILDTLIQQEKWMQSYQLVTTHNRVHGIQSLPGFAFTIQIEQLIAHLDKEFPNEQYSNLTEKLVDCFLRNGGRVDRGGHICITNAVERQWYNLLNTLICHHHCDPQYLNLESCTTPIHSALFLGLHKDPGNFSVFHKCLELYAKNPDKYARLDPKQLDINENTLFHLVAKETYNTKLKQVAVILQQKRVPCKVQNKDGKLPLDYLKASDPRYKILQKAVEYDTSQMKTAEKQKKTTDEPTIPKPIVEKRQDPSVLNMERIKDKPKQYDKSIDSKPKIQPKITNESYLLQIRKLIDSIGPKQSIFDHSSGDLCKEINVEKIPVDSEDVDESDIDQMELGIWHGSLEGKQWEVECTSGVLKSLQSNRIKTMYKERIVKIINALASGIYSKSCFKPLVTGSDKIKLFESKISSASRLIWEVGKQFSPRLTMRCEQQVNVYTDIIRIWEVVMEHKNIHQAVEKIVSSIEKSHEKGASCLIQKKLCGMKAGNIDLSTQQNNQNDNRKLKTPNIYVELDEGKENKAEEISFFPPASSKETEYSTIKFYTFSSNVALNILHRMKGEFPFRVTDVEYQITNLPFDAPIVLIGRSGTGKTTCCVYRLWYRFQQYWWSTIIDEPTSEEVQSENTDDQDKEDIRDTCLPNTQESVNENVEDESLHAQIRETNGQGSGACCDKSSLGCNEDENNHFNTEKKDVKDEMRCDENVDELRQIFITKNGVLCREVQKMFKSFIDGDEKTSRLFKTKDEDLPNRFQDINKMQYPVFITAKHFWLMLDATLGPPYYFERHIDGSSKSEIEGWTDIDDMQTILDDEFDSEYSDESESDEEEEFEVVNQNITLIENKRTRMKKVDPRREVTYEVFEGVIWPRIIGKFKKHKGKYHPSLVWTEIMSIIKGSYEAIYGGRYLDKNSYFEIGKKQAPAFVDEREILYTFFLEYEHIRQNRHMFDQTDLVQNLYQRFRKQKIPKWKVKEIYVDEAQDFAQAELFLLIKLCESPHGMFVTGDTAQSIMKGIAFRFKDLISLFHYASKDSSVKTVGVSVQPDHIYELPHNYRSHSGITALATSVLDILKDLFPDSFDSLPSDQCLFKGPKPVLLETVSSDQLSLILCENLRETSKIEFGAHQAILVVNDKARDNIPDEMKSGLILTLYEAKGLEFDDVLLYNIFTDSEATKEWRVVLSFLEKLAKKDSKNESKIPLQVSADLRPLPFNPKQHKVLSSELKQLYTAITRARQNVWIFDEDKEQRKPIFEYFQALHLVELVAVDKEVKSFTRKSTPREWVDKGEEFMKLKMYTQAVKCFNTAGDSRMEDIAHAYQHYKIASTLHQNSPQWKEELLLATLKFLDAKKIKEAAKCLETAKQFDLAAELYEKREQFEKAAEMYRRSKKPLESCKYYERAGRYEKSIDVHLENKQFEEAIHSLHRYQENPNPEKTKVRDNQTEDQINRNAAEYYHTHKNRDEMEKALNRIHDIPCRVMFLEKKFDGENDYIKLAASILLENGQTRKAASLYVDYGYAQEARPLFRKDKETYMIGICSYLDSLKQITIRADGSAICSYSTNTKEMTKQLEEAIFYFNKCRNKYRDRKCNYGEVTDEIGKSNLLLGRLNGQQKFIGTAFNCFVKRKPHTNEVGKLECLSWMVNNSNLKIDANLSKIVIGMENLFKTFLILVPLSKLSTRFTEPKKEQFLRDNGVKLEIGNHYYNPIHKPRILEVLAKVHDPVTLKTVKTVVDDVPAIYKLIVEDLLTKTKLWLYKIIKSIEEERQKLSKPTIKSQNFKDRSLRVIKTKVPFTHSEVLQLIRLDMHNVKLEQILNECNTKLGLNREQNLLLNQSEQRSFQFFKCRRLMEDLILTVPHISNTKPDVFEILIGVRSQMEIYFESELASSKKIETSVARFFEFIFFKKILGLQQKVNDSLTNLEFTVLQERKKNMLGRQKAYCCGFISKINIQNPFALFVVRSFKESIDYLKLYHNPYKALKRFSIFIERMNKQQTEETIPELTLLIIWVKYFTSIGLSMQSKFCGMQKSGKKCHFVIPSSYITTSKFVERCMFYSNAWTTDAMICSSKEASISDDIPDFLEKNIEILAGIRGNINIISIIFRRLNEYLHLQESSGQITREDEALSSIIDMAEDVILLSMVYVINMGEGMSYKLEPFLFKEFAVLENSERYPRYIYEAIHGIQTSSGIADICICVNNLLKQKGDSLIKCAWDNQKKHISKEQIESVFNTRYSFFLPQTLRILSDPTSYAQETNEEIQTIQQEIEIDDEEIRTVREEQVTVEKKKIENFILQTLTVKENLQSKVSIGNDECLNDPLFSGLLVNEGGCDVCGCSFGGIGDDEEQDDAGITTNHQHDHERPSPSTVSMKLKSIARSLSSTSTENFPTATSSNTQSIIQNEQIINAPSIHSGGYLSQRSVSLESDDNRDFVRSLSSTSDDQARLTMQAFEEHTSSLSHKTKMKEVQIFYEDYKKYIKPGLEKVRQFITKYELSGDISERYGEDEIRISQLLSRFEDCNADLAEMIKSKQWKTLKDVEKKLHQLVELKLKLRDSVKELSSVKLKTDIAEPHNDIDELEYKPQKEKNKHKTKGRRKNNWRKINVNLVD
ncbi:TPR and ankyrin repeat-containing protein 1-like [Mytilus trossulus]|uniref:TPR and ankyrin repeat-containing protein 1-like n=1 Tax=Mytilus trossulus TaxID=6551 RepID=UPI00300654DB